MACPILAVLFVGTHVVTEHAGMVVALFVASDFVALG